MKQDLNNNIGTILENSFAAAGLAEGDRDTAKQYLASEPDNALWKSIKQAYHNLQNHFAAAGLAEESQETARSYIKENLSSSENSFFAVVLKKAKQWSESLEHASMVAGLSEGDPAIAQSYLNKKQSAKPARENSLTLFLSKTGLKGVPYQYGLMAA